MMMVTILLHSKALEHFFFYSKFGYKGRYGNSKQGSPPMSIRLRVYNVYIGSDMNRNGLDHHLFDTSQTMPVTVALRGCRVRSAFGSSAKLTDQTLAFVAPDWKLPELPGVAGSLRVCIPALSFVEKASIDNATVTI